MWEDGHEMNLRIDLISLRFKWPFSAMSWVMTNFFMTFLAANENHHTFFRHFWYSVRAVREKLRKCRKKNKYETGKKGKDSYDKWANGTRKNNRKLMLETWQRILYENVECCLVGWARNERTPPKMDNCTARGKTCELSLVSYCRCWAREHSNPIWRQKKELV